MKVYVASTYGNSYVTLSSKEYVKETAKFFVESNGRRDIKVSDYKCLSTNENECWDYLESKFRNKLKNAEKRLDEYNKKLELFLIAKGNE